MLSALIVFCVTSVSLNLFLWLRWHETERLLDEVMTGRARWLERVEKRRQRL